MAVSHPHGGISSLGLMSNDEAFSFPAPCSQTASRCGTYATNRTVQHDSTFPYQIPYSATQSCDIYGALCQPGLITVNSTGGDGRPTSTTLPCSSYLSAQKTYILGIAPDNSTRKVPEWDEIFGRSPQCWSFGGGMHDKLNSNSYTWTYSECGNQETVYSADSANTALGMTMPPAFPPRVVQGKDDRFSLPCCAGCALNAADIRLYYFKDQRALDYCNSHNRQLVVSSDAPDISESYVQKPRNVTNLMFINSTQLETSKQAISLAPDNSIAVVSGQTL